MDVSPRKVSTTKEPEGSAPRPGGHSRLPRGPKEGSGPPLLLPRGAGGGGGPAPGVRADARKKGIDFNRLLEIQYIDMHIYIYIYMYMYIFGCCFFVTGLHFMSTSKLTGISMTHF